MATTAPAAVAGPGPATPVASPAAGAPPAVRVNPTARIPTRTRSGQVVTKQDKIIALQQRIARTRSAATRARLQARLARWTA